MSCTLARVRRAAVLLPLLLSSLAAAQPSLDGLWLGALDVGGAKLRLALHITKDSTGFSGTMDSIDQGASGIPIDTITFAADAVRFEIHRIGGIYQGTLNQAKSAIEGKWSQGGATFPLNFERTDKVPELARPQDPKKPYPYNEEEVAYENKKGGVKLAGTLTWPRTTGPFAAALLITGSGAQDRNETVMGHHPFLVLSDHLTRHGIAVLRVDDRGVGGSTGSTANSTSADFAGDVLAGIDYLKSRKEVNPAEIGLIGHSEGGLIAPMVAAGSSDVAYIVMIAGPGMRGDEILLAQGEAIAKAMGEDPKVIAMNRVLQQRIFQAIRGEPDRAAAEKKIREAWAEAMAQLPAAQQKMMNTPGALETQLELSLSPWFRYFLDYDPIPALRKVKCPVLALNGQRDLQVPTENLTRIAAALESGGNRDYEIVKLAGLNHLLQTCVTGSPTEYAQIQETMSPVALDLISTWILRHMNQPRF
jgi:pimeloyl-ACP methyl ester carboxylesterase